MSEPTDETVPAAVPGVPGVPGPSSLPGPPGPQSPDSPAYGAYVAPSAAAASAPEAPARSGDLLGGVLAGLIAAALGAALWAVVVAVTHVELGIIAVFVGYGVGWAVHRFGPGPSINLAVIAAVLAALGILAGFVLAGLLLVGHGRGMGVFDVYSAVIDWPGFINASVGGVGWLFLAIGAFGAFRLVAQRRRA